MKNNHTSALFRILNLSIMILIFCGNIYLYKITDISGLSLAKIFSITTGLVTLAGLIMLTAALSFDVVDSNSSTRMFFIMIALTFFGVITDNMSWILEIYQYNKYVSIINEGLWIMSYILTPLLLYIYWEYQSTLFPDQESDDSIINVMMHILIVLHCIGVSMAAALGRLFWVDDDGIYHIGEWYLINYVFAVPINLIAIADSLRKKIPLFQKSISVSFYVLPIIVMSFFASNVEYSFTYTLTFMMEILIFGTLQMQRGIHTIEKNAELAMHKQLLAEQSQQLSEQEKELTIRKMQIMVTQIQPHFMYNTLTTISGLCEEDPALASETTDRFADYLRMNVDSLKDTRLVFFEKELEHTKTYLWLEKLRFGKRVNYEFDLEEKDFMIPPLTLQPVVENAVKHGICKKKGGGTIMIRTRKSDQAVTIIIEDDGVGFDPSVKKIDSDGREHVGMENVDLRLKLICKGSLTVESEPGKGTKATIVIPVA